MEEVSKNPVNSYVKERNFHNLWEKLKKDVKRNKSNLGNSKRNVQVRSWRFTSFLFSGRGCS